MVPAFSKGNAASRAFLRRIDPENRLKIPNPTAAQRAAVMSFRLPRSALIFLSYNIITNPVKNKQDTNSARKNKRPLRFIQQMQYDNRNTSQQNKRGKRKAFRLIRNRNIALVLFRNFLRFDSLLIFRDDEIIS